MFQLKANRTSIHIEGVTERTKGSEFNYSLSACGALSRSFRFETLMSSEDLAGILSAARLKSQVTNRKLCKNCEQAAVAQLEG